MVERTDALRATSPALEERGNAEAGAETIDRGHGAGEFVFLNLRLREGFALADFHERFGRSFDASSAASPRPLFNDGLLTLDRGRIS